MAHMEFFDTVQARRSCRHFTSEPVPPEVINKALDAALIAPNSSNMQLWQFYWVRGSEKKKLLAKFCMGQPAATTAQELIVAVSRWDIWPRNQQLILQELKKNPKMPKQAFDYYQKLMPLMYRYGWFNIFSPLKWLAFNAIGFLRPVPRGPVGRAGIFEVMSKSTALACQNFMLAISAQGFGTCPMEGFDESRVKKLLGLNRHSSVTMVIGVGRMDPKGIWGERFRVPRKLSVHEIL